MAAPKPASAKRISPNAYQALRDALPVIFWNKDPFEAYLRTALREHPELLAGLNFRDLKRRTADALVDRLAQSEGKYQHVAIQLMVEVASMQRFPNLEKQEGAEVRVAEATEAVAELRRWTEQYVGVLAEKERLAAEQAAASQQEALARRFSHDVDELRQEFFELAAMKNRQACGLRFEPFLSRLFSLFDMEPRLAYSLEREQIDGSISFDTDDYIIEARWWKEPLGRDHADVFATKIRRKGRNALGLLVSVNGLTRDALDEYSHSTPFMVVDGVDLMAVLQQQVMLDDLLRRKKRHANETGHCYFPVARMGVV